MKDQSRPVKHPSEPDTTEPVTEGPSPPPTDAQWYSRLAMLARGETWPGPGRDRDIVCRCIRAALDKVNTLEVQLAKLPKPNLEECSETECDRTDTIFDIEGRAWCFEHSKHRGSW
jgi:hypothetical protein